MLPPPSVTNSQVKEAFRFLNKNKKNHNFRFHRNKRKISHGYNQFVCWPFAICRDCGIRIAYNDYTNYRWIYDDNDYPSCEEHKMNQAIG